MFMFQSTLSGPFLVAFIVILELSSSNSKGLNLQHDQRDDDQKRAFLEAFANVVKQPLYEKSLLSLCERDMDEISCNMEYNVIYDRQFSSGNSTLQVMTYNLDRMFGFKGRPSELAGLLSGEVTDEFAPPDIILLSELDRGCRRTKGINQVRQLAHKLKMNYVYSPEFILLSQSTNKTSIPFSCSTGNAILSKFRMSNFERLPFSSQCCFYSKHVGSRNAVGADIHITDGFSVRVYSAHLESGTTLSNELKAENVRTQQAAELAHRASQEAIAKPVIIGGDMNSPLGDWDPILGEFFAAGFVDAHESLPLSQRVTVPARDDGRPSMTIDFLLSKPSCLIYPGVCNEKCIGLSDHLPVFATLSPNATSAEI